MASLKRKTITSVSYYTNKQHDRFGRRQAGGLGFEIILLKKEIVLDRGGSEAFPAVLLKETAIFGFGQSGWLRRPDDEVDRDFDQVETRSDAVWFDRKVARLRLLPDRTAADIWEPGPFKIAHPNCFFFNNERAVFSGKINQLRIEFAKPVGAALKPGQIIIFRVGI